MLRAAQAAGDRVEQLASEIAGRGDFPAAARVIRELHEAVRRERSAVLDVARIILADPGLSSKVLRVVNSSFYRRRGEPISTITRAVIVLGFEPLCDLATGLVLLDQLARTAASRAQMREAVRRSLLCGLVSQALSVRIGYPNAEEARLLGLFGNWGTLSLAAFYPAEFERACALARERTVALDDAVREVFGVDPAALATAILKRWDFPDRYTDFFRRVPAADQPVGLGASARLFAVVELATDYSWHADGRASDACRSVAERYEALFARPADEFLGVTRAAVESLREHARLLHLGPVAEAGEEARGYGRAPAGACAEGRSSPDRSEPQAVAAMPPRDRQAALAIVAEITRAILEHEDINHTLSMVLEGIARTGSFDLVFLALLNVQKDRLVGRLAYGDGLADYLGALSVPLVPSGGVLAETMLAREPQTVTDDAPARLVPQGAPAASLRIESLVSHPLIVRSKAIGVLVAARSAAPVTPADLGVVRLFCDQASLALDRAAS